MNPKELVGGWVLDMMKDTKNVITFQTAMSRALAVYERMEKEFPNAKPNKPDAPTPSSVSKRCDELVRHFSSGTEAVTSVGVLEQNVALYEVGLVIRQLVRVPLNQDRYDALASWVCSYGSRGREVLEGSNLLEAINAERYDDALLLMIESGDDSMERRRRVEGRLWCGQVDYR